MTGGFGRVELAVNDVIGPGSQLSAQYKYTDDNVRGERHFVGGRLRIPLGAAPAASEVSPQWLRMVDRIERDVDIVIGQSGKEAVEDAITEVDFDQVVMTSAADTDDLQTVLTNAGGNSLIIADGADGTITGNATLSDDQTLQGGGSTIQVRGLTTGNVSGFTAPGARPTVHFDGSAPVLTVADRTHLAGLDVTGAGSGPGNPGNSGVEGQSDILAAFTDLDLSGLGGDGFDFPDATNATVVFRDVSVSDTGNVGIGFGSAASGAVVDFDNVWVSDTGDAGIAFVNADGARVGFTDVQVSDTGSTGISFEDAIDTIVDFTNVQVSKTGGDGIDFGDADNAVVDFTDVWITDTGDHGIDLRFADGLSATFTDVTFSGTIGDEEDEFLFVTTGNEDPPVSLNGNLVNDTDNFVNGDDALCGGDFVGTVVVDNGVPVTIIDGVGSDGESCLNDP